MKKVVLTLLIITMCFSTIVVVNSNAEAVTLGYTAIGAASDNSGANEITGCRFTASSSFTATQIKLYIASAVTGKVKCAIYSDSSGNPGSLLEQSAELTNPGSGWQTFGGMSEAINSGTTYWLVYWSNATVNNRLETTGANAAWKSATYGTWPSTFGTPSGTFVGKYSIYATDGTSATPTPTPTSTPTPTPGGIGILGYTSIGATPDNSGANEITGCRFTASSSFTATQIKLYIASAVTGKVKCAIYSDSSGNPGSLLEQSAELTNPGSGWQTFGGMSEAINSGTSYWLVYWANASVNNRLETTGANAAWKSVTYGTWPSTFGTTGGTFAAKYSIYAANGTSATPTPTPTPGGGVTIPAGANIQTYVNNNAPGTVFYLSGTYNNQSVTPKQGQTFNGQNSTTLDGGDSVENAFNGTASDVTIKNMTIQHYASQDQAAAVEFWQATGWTVDNCTVQNNRSLGVDWGPGAKVINNDLLNNGMAGFGGGGGNWLFENNLVQNNNTRHVEWGIEGGGGKITESSSGTVRGNTVTGNDGPGIWLDVDANNIIIENNICQNNEAAGIMVEISTGNTVRNNTCQNNGAPGDWCSLPQILISSASNNKVYGNITEGDTGITVCCQGREYCSAIGNEIYNNTITLHNVTNQGHFISTNDHGCSKSGINWHNNTYHLDNNSGAYFLFGWDNYLTFSQVQAQGFESGSTAD